MRILGDINKSTYLDYLIESYEDKIKEVDKLKKELLKDINRINMAEFENMKENKILKEWVDKMAEFLFNEYYQMTYVSKKQFNARKKDIVKWICEGRED